MTSKGAWVDDPVHDVLSAPFWDKMVDHGLTTGAIFLESFGNGFDPSYKPETLQTIRSLAHPRDVELVLTACPEPTEEYLAQFEQKIPAMLQSSGASALEFDMEGNWLPIKVKGFANLDKAGDAFVEVFARVTSKLDVRTELTTYTFHTENNKAADVAPHCDRVLPQAYSVYLRKEGGVDKPQAWDGNYGPGKMQQLTLDKSLKIRGVGTTAGPLICCGLAAYDQEWPGHTGEEAMRIAWNAALHYQPVEVRFWSTKWIFGVKANGYASRFLKSLKPTR
jgi:hypothetical protein